ncbi:MAG: hypothetical protein ACFE0R_13865 [Salinarimonas sp.]
MQSLQKWCGRQSGRAFSGTMTNPHDPTALDDLDAIRSRLIAVTFEAASLEIAEEIAAREAEAETGTRIARRRDARLAVVLADDAALGLDDLDGVAA